MPSAPHLVLVGPMGAGKSSLGCRIAAARGLAFVDLDREIETRAGAAIPQIFANEGEAGFRRREREALRDVLARPTCVIATGGGAVLAPDNREALRRHGFVVYLQIDVAEQLRRLAGDRDRPLIAGNDREAVLTALAAARAPLYTEVADLNFSPTGLSESEAGDTLADILRREWPYSADAPSTPPTVPDPS